jgi:hypothetical protein
MHRRRQMLRTCPGAMWYPVLEGECDMRVPQVSERIKEAPAQALRGVFAGIGQLLLITDKLRNKASHQDVPRAGTPEASETVTDGAVTSPADNGNGAGTAAAAPAPAAQAEAAPAEAAPAEAGPAEAGPAEAGPAPAGAVTGSETAAAAAAEATAAKPATTRRPAAKPVADKPVTAKPPAKPATAKPATAKPTTPRRTAAKAAAAEAAEAAGEAVPKPPKRQSSRNFDKTGNVRVLGNEADTSVPAQAAAAEPVAAAPEPVAAAPEAVAAAPEATVAAPEPMAATEPAAAAAPLANYDELSVASLRARLRNLDVAQVRELAEYERAHAARADVLTMFERRIAKLEAEA